jgi:hypothetical protein
LNISNKSWGFFSKNASSAFVDMSIIKNRNSITPDGLKLRWFDHDSVIKKNIDYTNPYIESADLKHYLDILPNTYGQNIPFQTDFRRNLPIDTDQEIIILFTVEGLDHLCIINQTLDRGGFYESNAYDLKFGEYDIRLVFGSNEYNDSRGKVFKLKVKDWNDVELT